MNLGPKKSAHGSESGSGSTWAALLGKWTEFAQAAKSLPEDGQGKAWRESVAPVIGLQAVTFALGEFVGLPAGEQGRALDLAEVLIRRHAAEIHSAWAGDPLPEKLAELIADARDALAAAADLSAVWMVHEPEWVARDVMRVVELLERAGFGGDVFAPIEGTILMRGEPRLVVRPWFIIEGMSEEMRAEVLAAAGGMARAGAAIQVYRQFDEKSGRIVRDEIALMRNELLAGRPLLECVMARGEVEARGGAHDADSWEKAQRAAMPEGGVQVVIRDGIE